MTRPMIAVIAALAVIVWAGPVVTGLLFALWPVFYIASVAVVTGATVCTLAIMVAVTIRLGPGNRPEATPAPEPVALPTPRPVYTASLTDQEVKALWVEAVVLFCLIAKSYDDRFTADIMSKHTTGPGWRALTDLLRKMGIVTKRQGGVTVYSPGWNYYRVKAELTNNLRALPHHPRRLPPPVYFRPPVTNPTNPTNPTNEAEE